MTSRRIPVVVAGLALVLIAITTSGQSAPPKSPELALVDLGDLGLSVASVQVVPELLIGFQQDVVVKPKPGFKTIVVTMAGAIKEPGRYVVWPQLFAVVYEKDDATYGEVRRVGAVVGAEHVGYEWLGSDRWVATSETSAVKAGPVSFKFAVTLPVEVTTFRVLCATGVGKPVELPAN